MAATSDSVRDSYRQEIRHDHYVVYRFQHVDDDAGPLSADGDIQHRPRLSQHDFHSDIQFRVPTKNICLTLSLFRGAMESVRFRCSNVLHTK